MNFRDDVLQTKGVVIHSVIARTTKIVSRERVRRDLSIVRRDLSIDTALNIYSCTLPIVEKISISLEIRPGGVLS